MKKINLVKRAQMLLFFAFFTLVFLPDFADAQRMRAAAAGGGGARPAATRQASPGSMARPASRPQARPAAPSSRPTSTVRPANTSPKPTINGGSNRVSNPQRPTSKVGSIGGGQASNQAVRPGGNGNTVATKEARPGTNNSGNRPGNNNSNRPGNNNSNRPGNNINIDNSTNININNNYRPGWNVGYRPPYRPYPRPPYYWGGYGFSYFRPYYYHPYTPYYWGPAWHPFGFFVATLAVTAIVISVENQKYHYDSGVFYIEQNGGYVVVEAPQGATVKVIPADSEKVEVSPTINNYYYGGTFYEKSEGGYTVVPPPAGSLVENLPEGAEEVKIGDETFVRYGETYYLPVQVDGKNMYEIVQVDEVEEK